MNLSFNGPVPAPPAAAAAVDAISNKGSPGSDTGNCTSCDLSLVRAALQCRRHRAEPSPRTNGLLPERRSQAGCGLDSARGAGLLLLWECTPGRYLAVVWLQAVKFTSWCCWCCWCCWSYCCRRRRCCCCCCCGARPACVSSNKQHL